MTTPTRIIVDLATGQTTQVELSGAELDTYNASLAQQAAEAAVSILDEPLTPLSSDSVTFEKIELDANKEYLLLKVAYGQPSAQMLINVDDAYGNNQQSQGVLDNTGRFGFLAPMSEMQDGPLSLTAVVYAAQGDIQAQATFELSRGV
jgi:hypothetical protein